MLRPLQIAGMFALTLVGWLCFRETELAMLWRDLTLSPWAATDFDRRMGAYLFLSTAVYALPLWIDDVWAVYVRPGHAEARRSGSSSRGGAEIGGGHAEARRSSAGRSSRGDAESGAAHAEAPRNCAITRLAGVCSSAARCSRAWAWP